MPPSPPHAKRILPSSFNSSSISEVSSPRSAVQPYTSSPHYNTAAAMSLSASINYSSFPDSAQMLLPTPPPSISTSRPPPRQIHRNRASYSCHSCRRRKVKCDRQHPTCGNCSKNGELCVFADNTGKGAANKKNKGSPTKRTRTGQFPGSDDGSSDGFRSASHSRSSSYNQSDFSGSFSGSPFMDTQVSPQMIQFPFPPAQLPPAEIETRATKLAEIMDHWYRVYSQTEHQPHDLPPDLKSVVGAFPKTPQVDRWPTGHIIPEDSQSRSFISKSREQENFAPQTQARATECLTHAQKDGNGDDVAMGYLSIQDDGQSRYVGTSFWALLSNEIPEVNQVLKSANYSESISSSSSCGLSTPPHSINSPSPSEDTAHGLREKPNMFGFEPAHGYSGKEMPSSILNSIPPKSHCDILYRSFLEGVNPIIPLIHVPTFAAQWRGFWSRFPDGSGTHGANNSTFTSLLLAVLFAGATSMNSAAVKARFDGRSKEVITSHLFSATNAALAATAFHRSPTINSLMAYLILNTCLVRDDDPIASSSFVGTAMRIAQQMGLHRDGALFGLGTVECEVRRRIWWHIMHLDIQGSIATGLPPLGGSGEDQFDTKMVSELRDEFVGNGGDVSLPSNTSPAMILAVGRYETAQLLRKIMVRLLGIRPPRKHDIAEMGQMVHGLKIRLDEKITIISARRGIDREAVFGSWAKTMLGMMSDRAYGVLYQPFSKCTKSRMWVHARHCALASAQSYLRSFNHLSRQDYSMYHWYLPSTQQPLHATIMLLVDLHERPLAAEAAQSRALVDEVLALFSDHSGEAWRMLRRARLGAQQVITKWSCLEEELGNVVSSEHGEIVAGHEDGTAAAGEPVFDWPDWDRVFGFGEDWMEE